jgi:maltose alpha-D-glucosyltransferase/alpha-amylase
MIDDLWYKNSVIYSLDVDTFMDGNGDGIGDFEGLVRQLDYLHSIGIDAIWLAPFQPTPNRDNGYDISDHYGVDPRHGSSGDFVEFMHQAHKRGIKVIIDLVVNHTSDQHPWFQEARKGKNARFHDWYVWSKKRPENWNEGMVFPGVQEATWTYDKSAREYYFHRFFEHQPDLNTHNPEVRTEIRRIMGYWLQLGVAGFRVDAVPFIIETPGENQEKEMRFDFLYEFRRFLQWRQGDAVLLGEANVLPAETIPFFGEHDNGIHMMFNFYVNQYLFYALATGEVSPLVEALQATRSIPLTAQWAHFLRNHDELDLGRLTDEQRQKVFECFAPEARMQLYDRGIRRRLATMLDGKRPRIELAYSLMFALPGTPVMRYGDEIGMGDNLDLPERDAVRTPMQWSDAPQAGFSDHADTVHPLIDRGEFSYKTINVAAQRRDGDSLLNWTARMIRLRKECPEIGYGDWVILETGNHRVLAMRYDWLGNSLVILHNFDNEPQEVEIEPGVPNSDKLFNLIQEETSHAGGTGRHCLKLKPYGYLWYRVGGLTHLLHRQRE